MNEIYVSVPIAKCVLYQNPTPRSEEEVLELAKDIGLRGMIHNPVARVKCLSVRTFSLKNFDEVSFQEDLANGEIEIEIGPGQTRTMAAIKLSWKEITVKLVEMDDQQFSELMVSENLKRHDMHPMDVSDYLQKCQDRKESIKKIAQRHGFTEAFVKKMLKLQGLNEPARAWFRKKAMTLEQAINLASTDHAYQANIDEHIEQTPVGPLLLIDPKHIIEDYNGEMLRVPDMAWKDDQNLYPEAGTCTGCLKRTDIGANLFSEWLGTDEVTDQYRGQRCMDRACSDIKRDRWQQLQIDKVKALCPNAEEFKYVVDRWRGSAYKGNDPQVVIQANEWEVLGYGEIKPCTSRVVVGRCHPEHHESDFRRGKILAYCTDPKCEVHKRYGSLSRSTPSTIKGEIVATPLPSEPERKKLAKLEDEAVTKAEAKAKAAALNECLAPQRREVKVTLPTELLFWGMFEALARSNEMATDQVLRRIAKEENFSVFNITGYSWWNGLASRIIKGDDKMKEFDKSDWDKWRQWLIDNQQWFIAAVITNAANNSAIEIKFPELAKAVWNVDFESKLAAAKDDLNESLAAKREAVRRLESEEAVLIESIEKVLESSAAILWAEEGMELLGKAIHGQLPSLTSVELKALIKYLGGAVKRTDTTEEMETMVNNMIEIWRKRIAAKKQKAAIAAAIEAGGHKDCPECDAVWSVDEIISQTCKECGHPNPTEEFKARQKAEVDEALEEGGVSQCTHCQKQLTPKEIIEQYCYGCDNDPRPDEDDDDVTDEEE